MTGTGVHLLQAAANERCALPRSKRKTNKGVIIDWTGNAYLKKYHRRNNTELNDQQGEISKHRASTVKRAYNVKVPLSIFAIITTVKYKMV